MIDTPQQVYVAELFAGFGVVGFCFLCLFRLFGSCPLIILLKVISCMMMFVLCRLAHTYFFVVKFTCKLAIVSYFDKQRRIHGVVHVRTTMATPDVGLAITVLKHRTLVQFMHPHNLQTLRHS